MAKLHSLVIPICLVIGAIVVSFLGFYEGWITNTSDYTTLVVSGVVVAMLGSSGPLFRRAFTQETISQVEPIISCKVNPRRLGSNDKILLKGKSLSVFVSVGHGENVALDAVVHEGGNAPLKRARVMAKFKLLEIGIPPKPERITGQSNESYQLSLSSHEEIKQSLENQCFPSGVVQIGNEQMSLSMANTLFN